MLISALCDYYDMLASQGKVIPSGFSQIGVTYRIALNENGEIDSITDIRDEITTENKSKKIPHPMQILKRIEKSAICSNYIEHRGLYIFGLNYDKKTCIHTPYDKNDAARKKHEAFVKTNLKFIDGIDSPVVNAFRKFIETWKPADEISNPLIVNIGKDIESANFIFCLFGYPEILLHEDEYVLKKWNDIRNDVNNENEIENSIRQCAILGEKLEIARLHNKIKGIRGGQASGTSFICFNNDSESSYGNEQSFNSNVSEQAMEKYTEALNYLLASKFNHSFIDELTIVYWSQNGDEKSDDLMSMLTFDNKSESGIDDEILSALVKDFQNGVITKEKLENFEKIDLNSDYYFVGIKPNSSRLSLKFIYRKHFGEFILNTAQHQEDLKIIGLERNVPIWKLSNELVPSKSKDKTVNPALIAKVLDSILNGMPYPEELLQNIVQRVKAEKEINPIRAGIIKAYINRKNRFIQKEEDFYMSLDKDNTNQAYLCGRMFAILEQIQQKASNYKLNRTIKDSYFSSAAARPANIFPKIIKLSNYHLSKLGNPKYFCDVLSEITEKLGGEFPATLSIIEQGKFILGYYHQINNTKKTNNAEEI